MIHCLVNSNRTIQISQSKRSHYWSRCVDDRQTSRWFSIQMIHSSVGVTRRKLMITQSR